MLNNLELTQAKPVHNLNSVFSILAPAMGVRTTFVSQSDLDDCYYFSEVVGIPSSTTELDMGEFVKNSLKKIIIKIKNYMGENNISVYTPVFICTVKISASNGKPMYIILAFGNIGKTKLLSNLMDMWG
mgnify:CR=1 FL=1